MVRLAEVMRQREEPDRRLSRLLDETDFHGNPGCEIYGMGIATPGQFRTEKRQQGRS